jgi:hypothetical protein
MGRLGGTAVGDRRPAARRRRDAVIRQADPAAQPAGSTGVGPDGWAAVAPFDLGVVLGALADAAACHDRPGGDPAAPASWPRHPR